MSELYFSGKKTLIVGITGINTDSTKVAMVSLYNYNGSSSTFGFTYASDIIKSAK